jgi:hypothetical protein
LPVELREFLKNRLDPFPDRPVFYCLSKAIVYGDGFSRRQLKHAVFFASALSGRNQASRYAGGC